MLLTALRRWPLLAAVLLLLSCGARESSLTADFSGEYVFTPHQQPSAEFADFLVLRPDGTAVEIRYTRSSGQVSTTEKRWSLSDKGEQRITIGTFGHSIEGTGSKVRLYINHDLNEYYQKVR